MAPVTKSCNNSRTITHTQFIESVWPKVRAYIGDLFFSMYSDNKTVKRILECFNGRAGRLRPALAASIGRIFSVPDDLVIPFAALVEIVHTASLVHDDIQDRTEKRRGGFSLWKKYSIDEAVILGDCLFLGAYRIVETLDVSDSVKMKVLSLFNAKTANLISGQLYDGEGSRPAKVDEYERISAAKTGSLFGLAVCGPYLLAKKDPERYREDFEELETCLGSIYQMRDDIADLLGKKKGRPAGDDFLKGHVTVFTFLARDYFKKGERSLCDSLIRRFRDKKDRASYDGLLRFYKERDVFARLEELYTGYRSRILASGFLSDFQEVKTCITNLLDGLDFKHVIGGHT